MLCAEKCCFIEPSTCPTSLSDVDSVASASTVFLSTSNWQRNSASDARRACSVRFRISISVLVPYQRMMLPEPSRRAEQRNRNHR